MNVNLPLDFSGIGDIPLFVTRYEEETEDPANPGSNIPMVISISLSARTGIWSDAYDGPAYALENLTPPRQETAAILSDRYAAVLADILGALSPANAGNPPPAQVAPPLPNSGAARNFYIVEESLAESDGDGLDDQFEWEVLGSNAFLLDSDGDGFEDAVELALGVDPGDPMSTPFFGPINTKIDRLDPEEDADGDTVPNGLDFDPFDENIHWAVSRPPFYVALPIDVDASLLPRAVNSAGQVLLNPDWSSPAPGAVLAPYLWNPVGGTLTQSALGSDSFTVKVANPEGGNLPPVNEVLPISRVFGIDLNDAGTIVGHGHYGALPRGPKPPAGTTPSTVPAGGSTPIAGFDPANGVAVAVSLGLTGGAARLHEGFMDIPGQPSRLIDSAALRVNASGQTIGHRDHYEDGVQVGDRYVRWTVGAAPGEGTLFSQVPEQVAAESSQTISDISDGGLSVSADSFGAVWQSPQNIVGGIFRDYYLHRIALMPPSLVREPAFLGGGSPSMAVATSFDHGLPLPFGRKGACFVEIPGESHFVRSKMVIPGEHLTEAGTVFTGLNHIWHAGRRYSFADRTDDPTLEVSEVLDVSTHGHVLAKNGSDAPLLLVPVEFGEVEVASGFDNYMRLLPEQRLDRPWLTVPARTALNPDAVTEANLLYEPPGLQFTLGLEFPQGKDGTITPAASVGSPQRFAVTATGPFDEGQFSYEGRVKVQNQYPARVAAYQHRTVTLAVHVITLKSDDEEAPIGRGNAPVMVGEGKAYSICIRPGPGKTLLYSTKGGDDTLSEGGISTGPNGICDTVRIEPDAEVIGFKKGEKNVVIVRPGPNGVLNSPPNELTILGLPREGDDEVVGEEITTGEDGIRQSPYVELEIPPQNVPTQQALADQLERAFGRQANIHFEIVTWDMASVAYDIGVPGSPNSEPNSFLDYNHTDERTVEEELIKAAAWNGTVWLNLYYIPGPIGHRDRLKGAPKGFARDAIRSPYLTAYSMLPGTQEVLVFASSHEIGHNKLFDLETAKGLHHPRHGFKEIDGVDYSPPYSPDENFTLLHEEEDRKRLMWWNDFKRDTTSPGVLLKDECDKLHGVVPVP